MGQQHQRHLLMDQVLHTGPHTVTLRVAIFVSQHRDHHTQMSLQLLNNYLSVGHVLDVELIQYLVEGLPSVSKVLEGPLATQLGFNLIAQVLQVLVDLGETLAQKVF